MGNRVLNEQLRGVPRDLLEEHVLDRIKHFAVVFAQELVPGITQQQLDLAFSRALYSISAQETSGGQAQLELRFNHSCRFMGCSNQDCQLCKNNPHKTCQTGVDFDEAYADNQVLKARCDAELYIELINQVTGDVFSAPGVEVQLSVIDGDAYSDTAPEPLATIQELHTSDEGVPLLQCYGSNRAIHVGTVVMALQNGRAKLPDVFITDKNDTFHFNEGATTGHFRLLALAMRRDELGNPVPVEGVGPAVSNSFVVKTQRALNDYRKSAYPHYKDELTRLRYIGAITANRLKDARAWLGKDVPIECVDSVQTLKQLLEYADTNRHVEQKLLELLNMRGRHRHKWDFLRHVLAEKVVYDDNAFRVWYAPDANGCGLLYSTKQAQIQNMEKPAGVARRVARPDGTGVVQVMMLSDMQQQPHLVEWRRAAEEAWRQTGHPGWHVLQEEIDYVSSWPAGPERSSSQGMSITSQGNAGNLVSSASPGVSPLEQLDIAAAAAGGGGDYPPVSRQQLEVQHQLQQRQQLTGAGAYPNITPAVHGIEGFGAAGISTQPTAVLRSHSDISPILRAAADTLIMRSQSDATALAAAAAAAGYGARVAARHPPGTSGPPLRTVSDISMNTSRATITTHQVQQRQQPIPEEVPAAEDAAGSAFMLQHPFDAVEVALQQQLASDSTAAGTSQGGSSDGGGAARAKRGRGAGEVHAVADPENNAVIFTTASRGRHQPMARTTAEAGGRGGGMSEFVSLTAEDLEVLQWTHSDRQEQQQAAGQPAAAAAAGLAELQEEEEELVTNGMPLTSTFSNSLRIGDSNFDTLPSLSAMPSRPQLGQLKQLESDSFKRLLGDIGVGSVDLQGIDALLNAPANFPQGNGGLGAAASAGDSAAAADQQRSKPAPASQ